MTLPNNFIAVDFETTGLIPQYDHPREIACVVFRDGVATGEVFHKYIQVSSKAKFSPESILCGEGVTSTDKLQEVVNALRAMFDPLAPTKQEVMAALNTWCEEVGAKYLPNVAHRATFDWGFYDQHLLACTTAYSHPPLSPVWICTKTLAKQLLPKKAAANLATCCKAFGIEHELSKAHDALYDATKCGELYAALLKEMNNAN